jgi:hypothetical protein
MTHPSLKDVKSRRDRYRAEKVRSGKLFNQRLDVIIEEVKAILPNAEVFWVWEQMPVLQVDVIIGVHKYATRLIFTHQDIMDSMRSHILITRLVYGVHTELKNAEEQKTEM